MAPPPCAPSPQLSFSPSDTPGSCRFAPKPFADFCSGRCLGFFLLPQICSQCGHCLNLLRFYLYLQYLRELGREPLKGLQRFSDAGQALLPVCPRRVPAAQEPARCPTPTLARPSPSQPSCFTLSQPSGLTNFPPGLTPLS